MATDTLTRIQSQAAAAIARVSGATIDATYHADRWVVSGDEAEVAKVRRWADTNHIPYTVDNLEDIEEFDGWACIRLEVLNAR